MSQINYKTEFTVPKNYTETPFQEKLDHLFKRSCVNLIYSLSTEELKTIFEIKKIETPRDIYSNTVTIQVNFK